MKYSCKVPTIWYYHRCAPDWESNDHIVYTVIWLFIGFLIPLSVIIYSSISTVIHMRKVSITNDFIIQNVPTSLMFFSKIKKIDVLLLLGNISANPYNKIWSHQTHVTKTRAKNLRLGNLDEYCLLGMLDALWHYLHMLHVGWSWVST